jgi:dihydrolipoamide dehydrogenase
MWTAPTVGSDLSCDVSGDARRALRVQWGLGGRVAHYDLAVIGAGPAGYAAAVRAWDLGKRVALIERGELGGAGVHDGALASKTLWELSKDYQNANRRDRGFEASNVHVAFDQVALCVRNAIREKVGQLQKQLTALGQPYGDHAGRIEQVHGSAEFVDANTLRVTGTEAGQARTLSADAIIVATGSRPRALPEVKVDGDVILTSDHILRIDAFPDSLVIVGAGVIGCEFATIFSNFGHTKVYLIDRADRILPFEDADVAGVCATQMEAKGVTIHRGAHLQSLTRVGDRVEYTIRHPAGGLETITVAKALISVGRVPSTTGLNLAAAGVEITERGHITCAGTATNVPHIHAVGDVTLDIALVNIGEIEGRHAVECLYLDRCKPLSYDNISTIMFLDPEVAGVGMNERLAQKNGQSYRVAVYGYDLVNRCIAMRSTTGFIKLLVTDDDEMRILGMRALGAHASTAIEAVSLMVCHGRGVRDLAELLHPHPAVTEALQDCVRMLLGSSIMKPHVFQSSLRMSRVTAAPREA